MQTITIQPLREKSWSAEERLTALESALLTHINDAAMHTYIDGRRQSITVSGTETKVVVWQDSSKAIKLYEETNLYDPASPANYTGRTFMYYDQTGKLLKRIVHTNFVYSGTDVSYTVKTKNE
ncbi:MAG: hypothetical protein DRJ03_02740 [Chloroflexi bacterium]|nr:MAG: hypothetical protein DRJ03_02740 [Chloroflexota bacterium]